MRDFFSMWRNQICDWLVTIATLGGISGFLLWIML